jgi:hypothetical protein
MLFDWIIPMKTILRGPVSLVFCAILSLGLLASQPLEARTSHNSTMSRDLSPVAQSDTKKCECTSFVSPKVSFGNNVRLQQQK